MKRKSRNFFFSKLFDQGENRERNLRRKNFYEPFFLKSTNSGSTFSLNRLAFGKDFSSLKFNQPRKGKERNRKKRKMKNKINHNSSRSAWTMTRTLRCQVEEDP